MNTLNHGFAWSLSLAIHLAAAALFGWLAGRALLRATPAEPLLSAIAFTFADTAVPPAAGSAAADDEATPVPRPETLPMHDETRPPPPIPDPAVETAPDAPVAIAAAEPRPPEQDRRVFEEDEKNPFFADLESLADPAEVASAARSGLPGSGEGDNAGFGEADVQAAARALIRPVYPVGARRRGEEGRVVLEVTVLATGRTGDPAILMPSGFAELDRAALNAIRRARFAPATRRGVPVSSRIRLTFIFNLRD